MDAVRSQECEPGNLALVPARRTEVALRSHTRHRRQMHSSEVVVSWSSHLGGF